MTLKSHGYATGSNAANKEAVKRIIERKQQKDQSMDEKKIVPPTNDAAYLTQLAIDIESGKVFTDWHCRDVEDIRTVFMPLMFGTLKGYDLGSIGMIYEYMSEAGPMAVNNMPTFFSMRMLNKQDSMFVKSELQRIRSALSGVKNDLQFNG